MSGEYVVHFLIRKGLGPDHREHSVFVGLDDLPDDTSETELKALIIADAESQLRRTEDYPLYGKNWFFQSYEQC